MPAGVERDPRGTDPGPAAQRGDRIEGRLPGCRPVHQRRGERHHGAERRPDSPGRRERLPGPRLLGPAAPAASDSAAGTQPGRRRGGVQHVEPERLREAGPQQVGVGGPGGAGQRMPEELVAQGGVRRPTRAPRRDRPRLVDELGEGLAVRVRAVPPQRQRPVQHAGRRREPGQARPVRRDVGQAQPADGGPGERQVVPERRGRGDLAALERLGVQQPGQPLGDRPDLEVRVRLAAPTTACRTPPPDTVPTPTTGCRGPSARRTCSASPASSVTSRYRARRGTASAICRTARSTSGRGVAKV